MASKRYRALVGAAAAALVLGSTLINVKNIFTSCQVDAEYQVAMAYRILQGDRMFSEMWEAHQTSAFFLAFFEWVFLAITGSTTGILVYANAVGVACKTVVAFCVYGTLRKFGNRGAAFAALLFALNAYPKDIVLPDFANLQIWFGLLLMCCLIWYFERQKVLWLVLAACCLCLEVLAYPSCVLIWPLCMILIGIYSAAKKRDMLLFTGVCGVSGLGYLVYFMRGKPGKFLQDLYYIWSGDESHAMGLGQRFSLIGKDVLLLAADMRYVLAVAVCAALAAWLCRTAARGRGRGWSRRKLLHVGFCWFLGLYILGYLIHLPKEQIGTKYHFFLLYLVVDAAAWAERACLNAAEKRIFVIGQMVGWGGGAATLLLSDLGLFSALPYLIPAICTCMLPLGKPCGEEADRPGWVCFLPAALFCAVILFRNLVYLNGWMTVPENFRQDSIFGVNWTVQDGPLKGIVNGSGAYVADVTYQECQNYIQEGDRVLAVSYPSLTAAIYLNQRVEICADSTISTPTYSERLFTYWQENPEKYPNVVIVKCFDGSLQIGEHNEVVEWLEREVFPHRCAEGTYWRYYYLE